MKHFAHKCSTFIMLMLLCLVIPVSAKAASPSFSDVPEDSPWYDSVSYLADHGITYGTGNGCYAPDAPLTTRQWATMLCRTLGKEDAIHDPGGYLSSACVERGYQAGWLQVTAITAPDTQFCRQEFYLSALTAFDIPVYDAGLYPDGESLPPPENALRVARELGLCGSDAPGLELVTRGEAAYVLHSLMTKAFSVAEPPLLKQFPITNLEQVDLNAYLVEIQKIPEPLLQAFIDQGWQYVIDFSYLSDLSKVYQMSCIGAASYQKKTIYVSQPSATVHEFGHFLDGVLGFPSVRESFYEQEANSAAHLLRSYSLTNEREYFADCFVFWIKNRDREDKMDEFRNAAPETYAFFASLEIFEEADSLQAS